MSAFGFVKRIFYRQWSLYIDTYIYNADEHFDMLLEGSNS